MNTRSLADSLNNANPFLDDEERKLAHATYRLLARGAPVALEDLVRESGKSIDEVRRTFDGWNGVFRDDQGQVVAFWGLALPEMDHQFEVGGRTLYTWCAWDPLFIAPLIGVTARVTSTCPVTGETITLAVGPDGVSDVFPQGAVLSFLRPTAEMTDDVIDSFCHFVRFFASTEAAESWIANHPGTFVIGMDEAFDLGRRTLGRLSGQRA